jgi:SEC-C motif domain protein
VCGIGDNGGMARRRPASGNDDSAPCPCGLGQPYDECCGPAHRGKAPATAEALMRSRYAAFVRDDAGYVLSSWHPSNRPTGVEPDPELRWVGLEIIETVGGGMFDAEGIVEFRAHYRDRGKHGDMRERSRFVRHDGSWVYWGPILADHTLAGL